MMMMMVASDQTCGWTKHPPRQKEVWWWNDKVDYIIREKKRLWKEWKSESNKILYLAEGQQFADTKSN